MSPRSTSERAMKRAAEAKTFLWSLSGGVLLMVIGLSMPGLVVVGVVNNDVHPISAQIELGNASDALSIPTGATRYLLRRFDGSSAVGLRGYPSCTPHYLPGRSISFRQYSVQGANCVQWGFRVSDVLILLLAIAFFPAAMVISWLRRARATPSVGKDP